MQNRKIQQQEQKQSNAKAQWLNFAQAQNKTDADYIKMITSDAGLNSDTHRLEAMVRSQLKREIPNVEKMATYELLVDAVMNNYMKKQLQATDSEIA